MAKLKYDRMSYFPDRSTLSLKEVKSEYRRLKTVAQRRLQRIGGTEFANTNTYKYNMKLFGKGKGSIKGLSERQIRKMLYQLQSFTSSDESTLTGLRKKRDNTIQRINDQYGEDIVNKQNYFEFIDFLNDKSMKSAYRGLDSGQVLELWEIRSKGLSLNTIRKDWSELLENKDEIVDYLESQKKKGKRISYQRVKGILND